MQGTMLTDNAYSFFLAHTQTHTRAHTHTHARSHMDIALDSPTHTPHTCTVCVQTAANRERIDLDINIICLA